VIAVESVELTNAYELGLTEMNGVGVMVAEATVIGAAVVQVNGIADVETPVSDRVSGLPVVNVGSPMLTVPEAPAVTAPDIVPGTETYTLPVG
jgi:ABC-type uncharacterized transport system permease subunit